MKIKKRPEIFTKTFKWQTQGNTLKLFIVPKHTKGHVLQARIRAAGGGRKYRYYIVFKALASSIIYLVYHMRLRETRRYGNKSIHTYKFLLNQSMICTNLKP